MGQYYKAIFLKPRKDNNQPEEIDEAYFPHDLHDNNSPLGYGAKLTELSYIGNNFTDFVESKLIDNPQRLVFAGDYANKEPDGYTLFKKGEDFRKPLNALEQPHLENTYVINHNKKEYYKRPVLNENELTANPLPLLTCEGNGQGGGDYFSEECEEMVGTWARDTIEIKHEKPSEDYTEIHPHFAAD